MKILYLYTNTHRIHTSYMRPEEFEKLIHSKQNSNPLIPSDNEGVNSRYEIEFDESKYSRNRKRFANFLWKTAAINSPFRIVGILERRIYRISRAINFEYSISPDPFFSCWWKCGNLHRKLITWIYLHYRMESPISITFHS